MAAKPLEDVDPEQLYQLSAEIRRLADRLAEGADSAVQAAPAADGAAPITAAWVRGVIRNRRLRDKYLGAALFADPVWDMLLDLYAARLEGRPVSVSSLCIAAAVPATTALRWITILEQRGILLRAADARDGRRILVELGPGAAEKMEQMLSAARAVSEVVL
ncbi:MAG TPA: MarR family transcriptional regulator [Allosphingosinicella sp.]|jgi:DNA-binding MarR family transcriptional regulator